MDLVKAEAEESAQDKLDSILSSGKINEASQIISEDYRVSIPNFEGPLDLLLHLIRKEQIDIHDIPLSKICKSYLDELELMHEFDVDVAGEFMVMAQTN